MRLRLTRFSFSALEAFLQKLSGRKRMLAAFGFGGAMALSMPPFNAFPLLWICLPALIALLRATTTLKQAFATGWVFAFGFFVFGLYWIAASMFVDIGRFWWAVPFAVAGLPALFALYYGIAAVIGKKIGLSGLSGAVTFGLLWFLADYARGHLFTGFPWILLGYAWSDVLPVLQITSVIGIYGLTLITAIAACLPAALERRTGKTPRRAFIYSLSFLVLIAGWGQIRLTTTELARFPNVRVRLVQPNISQTEKWREDERDNHLDRLIRLSSQEGAEPITHIFWPETASPYFLSESIDLRRKIAAEIPAASSILTGVIRRDFDEDGTLRFYNSLVALDGLGRLIAGYDKTHLVPFGEFMPLRKTFPHSIQAMAASSADFSRGPGPRSLRVLGLPLFSPLICYEVIFSGEVVDRKDRPEFMANLTNDAWYGLTTGPYQHFAIARVRSIEEGMSLVRIANTGVSGVVDPLGRIERKLSLQKEGVIDAVLAKPLPETLFSKQGNALIWSLFLVTAAANAGIVLLSRKRTK